MINYAYHKMGEWCRFFLSLIPKPGQKSEIGSVILYNAWARVQEIGALLE
jgi:hypothetical protein